MPGSAGPTNYTTLPPDAERHRLTEIDRPYRDGLVGAGDGTRTHDILLGKQTLYQLSYTRIGLLNTDCQYTAALSAPQAHFQRFAPC